MGWSYVKPPGWTTTTKRILKRDDRACYLCGGSATEVDHIVPRSAGGTDTDDNLAAICRADHETKTKAERAAGIRRRTPRSRLAPERHPGMVAP